MKAFVENLENKIFVSRRSGFSFPLHMHNHLELIYVHAGSIEISISNQSSTLRPGDLGIVFPNQMHSYREPTVDNDISTVILDLSYMGEYIDTLLGYHPVHPFIFSKRVHENIPYAIDQLNAENSLKKRYEIFLPFIHIILVRVFQEISLQENSSVTDQHMSWQIADYVNQHFHQPISLSSVAEDLGMCKYRLSRMFSQMFGRSFTTYVNSIRLYHACSLLAATNMSVTEVSEEAGFGSLRTFFRVFQAEHGMTPQDFRNNHRSGRRQQMDVAFLGTYEA